MREIDLKMAELNKKYKGAIINLGTDIIEVDKIPFSSPMANWMTYGGIPMGKITEFYGGEGGGKTTSALDIVKNAQIKFSEVYDRKVDKLTKDIKELEDKNTKTTKKELDKLKLELKAVEERGVKSVVYVDSEQTLDTIWAQLLGVNTDAMYLVRPQSETAEEVLQIIIDLIATGDIGLVVLDSIPMLVSQNIFDKSLENKSYGGISQALTEFCRKVQPYLTQKQCALIGINQVREDLGSMYNTESTPGGKMWKHACALRLRFKKDTYLNMVNEELTSKAENPAGNRVQIQITKTKVCKPDRRLGYYTLNYSEGIDYLYDAITLAIQYKIIENSQSWYYYNYIKDGEQERASIQGKSKMLNFLRENDSAREQLENLIEEMIK